MSEPTLRRPGRAIVIGASIAGLLAARVLADHVEDVVLMERDRIPDGPAPRKGTPQAVHPHGLLARGREVMETLFPGFTASLVAQGAVIGDLGEAIAMQTDGQRFASRHAGHVSLGASRLAIEAELRRRVQALPGVRLLDQVSVIAPVLRDGRVVGVQWHPVETEGALLHMDAQLVVDCSGRGSRAPAWLRDWGYTPPVRERVDVGIVYASAYYERDALILPEPAAVICAATPERPRPGVLIAQEPDPQGRARWVVGVGGYQGDHPIATPEGMLERARAIGNPEITALTESGRRIGPVMRYAFPSSLRRRYERLREVPRGFLVMGDALTSFNPIYGQGMTVAACEAMVLREVLARGLEHPAPAFFKAAARIIDVPWDLTVGGDLALPMVPGPRPMPVRVINAYIARLQRAARVDAEVSVALQKVIHLVAPPASLFAPGLMWRVWRHGAPRPVDAMTSEAPTVVATPADEQAQAGPRQAWS